MPASSLGLSVALFVVMSIGAPVRDASAVPFPGSDQSLRQSPVRPTPGRPHLQQTPSAQKPPAGFEPISEIPPEDRMPAAPMVIAAYAFVMLAFFAYVLSLARRLGAVKQEISRLESELKRSGRT
jgi:CcmD family protein